MRFLELNRRFFLALLAAFFGAVVAMPAYAETHFAGKQVRIVLPTTSLSSGYGLYGSLAANHLKRFIPGNPDVAVVFMPGATGLTALNYMFEVAPKDGTTIGVIPQDIAAFQAMKVKGVRYNAAEFNYLIRIAPNVPVHMVRGDSAAKVVADLKSHEIVTGAVGSVGTHNDLPKAMNDLLKTKWKIVSGYPGGSNVRLAIERGEVQAGVAPAALFKKELKDWLDTGMVRVVVQYADFRHPVFPEVPAVVELAEDKEAKDVLTFLSAIATIGRGFYAPPGTDSRAVETLRKAFEQMVKDETYMADAEKRGAETIPMSGEALKDYITRITQTPENVVSRARKIIEAK